MNRLQRLLSELTPGQAKKDESYGRRPAEPERDATRRARYLRFVEDAAGLVRADLLSFDLLLDEPFYQLVRQQLLAHELEKVCAEGADRVGVLHVLSPPDDAYQRSLARSEHRALGESVSEVWRRLLRARSLHRPAAIGQRSVTRSNGAGAAPVHW